jgi:type IV pilus assembly protein PilQ
MPPLLGVGLILMALCYASVSVAQQAVLQAVDVGSLPGNQVQLRFRFSKPVAAPKSFTINSPARVVLDFLDTSNGLNARQQPINTGVAERINVLQGSDRTRASINLARLVPYSVRAEGSTVLLTLEAGASVGVTADSPPEARTTPGSISNIDFRRGLQGQAIINIKLSTANINVNVREEGSQIVADFNNVNLARGQERRLDVTDFATPVSRIDAVNQNGNARIAVQPTGRYEFLAYQADDVYTIEVKPIQEEEEEDVDPRNKKFEGDLLSLNFQDIEVRAVLQIIADFTGLNVVVSDTVQGNLTLRLQNVPWDQALDIIMRTKGLTMRQQGNVIYIAPTEEVAAREKLELEAQQTVEDLIPLRTEIIRVNYAKASELATIIEADSSGGGDGGEEGSLLSPRGTIQFDQRTNSLLIKDIPENITAIRGLISQLDIPVRQVMVDSRIVIASDDFRKELGVRWGFSGVRQRDGGIATTSGSLQGTDSVVNDAIGNLVDTGQPFPVGVPALADRLGVDLGTDSFGSIALALLGRDYLVDLELTALQAEGRGEILSNPRIVTNDRIEASVSQGFEVPFITQDEGGNANVEFKDALLELVVTPQITPDNNIIMDLQVNKDEPDFGRAVQGQPSIVKREIKTQVLVANGETLVLGGVFEHTINRGVDKVPLLGDIPVLGYLFQRNVNRDQKLELLIFVTPQIITDGIAAR